MAFSWIGILALEVLGVADVEPNFGFQDAPEATVTSALFAVVDKVAVVDCEEDSVPELCFLSRGRPLALGLRDECAEISSCDRLSCWMLIFNFVRRSPGIWLDV